MRQCGVLLHITSLPSPCGVGTLGRDARRFLDFMEAAGLTLWQILPLGPTSFGDSPYQSFSTFAGNPYLIDLELLAEARWLDRAAFPPADIHADKVDYGWLYNERFDLLRLAFLASRGELAGRLESFRADNPWLDDYALFMALKSRFDGHSWLEWPDDIRLRHRKALEKYRRELAEDIAFNVWLQYIFFEQWNALKADANSRGVSIIGDMPIYVSPDSSDVWSNPGLFKLTRDKRLKLVAGVPPDYFSEDGQLWGNPVYRWERHARDGFGWWIDRMRAMSRMFDVVRLDHFIGYANYWEVKADETTARVGKWRIGPGRALFETIEKACPKLRLIAEDLGVVSQRVKRLVAECGYPTMKTATFAFGGSEDNIHLPCNAVENSVMYTGTHDNLPANGWWDSVSDEERAVALKYFGVEDCKDIAWTVIDAVFECRSSMAVIPMQDFLGLRAEAVMNRPGTVGGNWQWRLPDGALTAELAARIRECAEKYGRVPQKATAE